MKLRARWLGIFLGMIFSSKIAYSRDCYNQMGEASFYGSHHQEHACGKFGKKLKLTAAHPNLPCGTKVLVTNLSNRKNIIVTITDRGPFIEGRIIDLSPEAFGAISPLRRGVFPTKIRFCR